MREHKRRRGGVQIVLTAVVAAAIAAGGSALAADAKSNTHGAMAMKEQMARLDKLLPERDPTKPPPGFDPVLWAALVPDDNEMTPERIALGRKLYFDTRLSADGTVACATCHDVSRGFTDQRNVSEGIGDKLGRRNAPTTLNAVFFQTMFLDGRAASLEDQAKLPITNPIEMGMKSGDDAVAAIQDDEEYKAMFRAAYERDPNFDDVGRAIAAFERTLVFLDSPFDRFLAGDDKAISDSAKRGWALYNGAARCVSCHQINGSSPIGTDQRFHNVGVSARHQNFEELVKKALAELEGKSGEEAQQIADRLALETDMSEVGRFMVTRNRSEIGAFKTLQVRNVGVTGPYMHDGSMQTLWDVMDHYNKGGEPNAHLDGGIEPLALSEKDIDDVVELMFSMTDERFADDNAKQLAKQRALAKSKRPFRDTALAERKVFPFETRVNAKEEKKR